MSDDLTPRLGLPYLLPAQAQKHVTVNEALGRLDALAQLAVVSRSLSAPPAMPAAGECHLVGPAPSGLWSGQAGKIAQHEGGGWVFIAPQAGWRAHVLDEGVTLIHDGTQWTDGPRRLGVNAAPDAVNRLAVASAASLFTHEGGDHRLAINRAGTGDTASVVFQSGWTGLAEIGLAGGDGFTIKAFDGNTWYEALRVDAATRELLAGEAAIYHRDNLLGTVELSGGVPAGAVLERGTDANGSWLRLADGTQICSHRVAASTSAATLWTYPMAFDAAPVVTGTAEAKALSVLCHDAAPGASSASFSLRDGAGARRADMAHLLAVGRWG